MNEKWVLRRLEFNYFPKTLALGINASVGTAFLNYSMKNKVTYLWVALSFLCWQVSVRIPVKRYGIRGAA